MGVGDLPHPEEGAARRRPQHQCRRRGRLRAEPASRPTRRSASSCKAIESGRLQARRGRRARRSTPPSTEFFKDGKYDYDGEGKTLDRRRAWSTTSPTSSRAIPIVSIEDGMAEDDWDGWKALTDALGGKMPAGRRRSLRHQHRAPGRRHRAGHRPTRSWSRSTRSAR